MGCSLVRASKEVGPATWQAAEDGSSLDLKVGKGGIHKPPNPEAAATQRPTGQGLYGGLWTLHHDAMRSVATQASYAERCVLGRSTGSRWSVASGVGCGHGVSWTPAAG